MNKLDNITKVTLGSIIICILMMIYTTKINIQMTYADISMPATEETMVEETLIEETTVEPTTEETVIEEIMMEETTVEPTTEEELIHGIYTMYEYYELAKIIMCEAEGESQLCKEYVGKVVINRLYSNEFPDNIHDVIFQKKQFTPTFNGRWEKVEPNEACYAAAYKAMSDEFITDAKYFEARKENIEDSWHAKNLEFIIQLDNTRFYR